MNLRSPVLFGVAFAMLAARSFAASPTPRSSIATDSFRGALASSIPVEVPAFHGVEPTLALAYSSSGGGGLAGVGWSLAGFHVVERVSSFGQGAPHYDVTDRFILDGDEVVPCAAGMVSPSCATGGTHTTQRESYRRIVFASNTWTVTSGDGTRSVFAPTYAVSRGTFRWGLSYVEDMKGNRASYAWACDAGDCYPSSVDFGPYRVTIYREPRADVSTFATGAGLGSTTARVRSILVSNKTPIRAYRLTYATGTPRRTRLVAVQPYGSDVAIDAAGAITGGTAMPATTFGSRADPAAGTFVPVPPPVPTNGVEDVAWFKKRCAMASGSALWKSHTDCPGNAWDAGGSSSRTIASGDGYMEFSDGPQGPWHGELIAGLSTSDGEASGDDIDFGFRLYEDPTSHARTLYTRVRGKPESEVGTWTTSDRFRVAIEGGVIVFRRSGVEVDRRVNDRGYPLRASAALREPQSGVTDVKISGALVDLAGWCVAADGMRLEGDYNGDGRTDLLCKQGNTIQVRLGTGAGFAAATTWLTASLPGFGEGDFDGDGKTDVYGMDPSSGTFYVALSSGAAFAAPASWGANGTCNLSALYRVTTGDFNGDGRTDVACQRSAGNAADGVYVGLSTGSAFSHSRWIAACGVDSLAFAMDLDGDGRDDLACLAATGAVGVQMSTGSSFDGAGLVGSYILAHQCDPDRWQPGDFNGDGKTDLVCTNRGQIWLSIGRAFAAQTATGAFCTGDRDQALGGDVDGDGLADQICNHQDAPANDIEVRLGTGTGFAPSTTWLSGWCLGGAVATDLDGDRKTDLYCDETPQPIARSGTGGVFPDLITTWTNELGGTTSIGYAPSSTFPNVNNPPVVPVVVSLVVADGRGGVATSTYSYDGGLVDRQGRRYLGFAHQREIRPCDAAPCPKHDLYFAQDYGSLSKVKRDERRDGRGRLVDVVQYEYTTNGAVVPYTSLLTGTRHTAYPSGSVDDEPFAPCKLVLGTCSVDYATNEYDAYGNVRRTVDFGDLAITGDERHVDRQFYPNTAAFIVAKPGWESTMTTTGDGQLVRQVIYLYDGSSIWGTPPAQGYRTGTLSWHDATNSFVQRSTAYDAYGNVTSTTDETGLASTTDYDAGHLFPIRTVAPTGEVFTATYDPICAARVTATDANAQTTTTHYDALCRVDRVDAPLGAYEITLYVGLGDPQIQHVDTLTPLPGPGVAQRVATSYFDGLGRGYRTTRSGPRPIEQTTSFGADGQPAAVSAPYYAGDAAVVTRYTRDALGRVTRTVLPDGTALATSYGPRSVAATDAHGHVVTTAFDAHRQVTSRTLVIGEQAATTRQQRDVLGRLVGVTDPVGNQWTWRYDTLDRLLEVDDPDAGARRFDYDAAGRRTREVDARGLATDSVYDHGRLVSRDSDDGAISFRYGEARDGYANAGRLTSLIDPHGIERRDYDAAGRWVRIARDLDGTRYTLVRQLAPTGELVATTYPDGGVIGPLGYDAAGRLASIAGFVDDVSYTADGQPLVQRNHNGTTTTTTYDAARGWVASVATQGVQQLAYTYDAAGLVTGVTSPYPHESHVYAYDDLHRLVSSTNAADHGDDETFTYDLAGNMTSNSRVGTYVYPPAGTVRPHAPVSIAGVAQHYDDSGNLVAGSRTMTWSVAGKPTVIDGTAFAYDGAGRRLRAGSTAWPVGEDYEVTGSTATTYVTSPFGVIGKRAAGVTSWFHRDGLGSIQAITDASGVVMSRSAYTAYGELRAPSDEVRGFTGQRRDATGLMYLHARYYDPKLGIFVSPDSFDPSDLKVGTSRYAYALDTPTNGTDPTGHMFWFLRAIYDYWGFGYSEGVTVIAPADPPDFGGIPTGLDLTAPSGPTTGGDPGAPGNGHSPLANKGKKPPKKPTKPPTKPTTPPVRPPVPESCAVCLVEPCPPQPPLSFISNAPREDPEWAAEKLRQRIETCIEMLGHNCRFVHDYEKEEDIHIPEGEELRGAELAQLILEAMYRESLEPGYCPE